MITHELKTWSESFTPMVEGWKAFELRKNDRDFKEGDTLRLQEWNPGSGYTGRVLNVIVVWVLKTGFGLPEGYCIMSIEPLNYIVDGKNQAAYGLSNRALDLISSHKT